MNKMAMIARADNSGLGTLSWEFARHLQPERVLVVTNGVFKTFPERYGDHRMAANHPLKTDDFDYLLDGVDVVLSFETFYDWRIVDEARRRGVKTALVTMFEMSPERFPLTPDLLICPSTLDYEIMAERGQTIYLPIPLDTERLRFRKRKMAKLFVHTASHGGMNGRKGTQIFLDAIPLVKNPDAQFRIYSWKGGYKVPDDPRIEFQTVEFQNYWQCWREGDVLVYPQDYNGICLPISEAFASGMVIITTDMRPFSEWLPRAGLFSPKGFRRTRAAPKLVEVNAAVIDPGAVAAKIDELSTMDIGDLSEEGHDYSRENSWERLGPRWRACLMNL